MSSSFRLDTRPAGPARSRPHHSVVNNGCHKKIGAARGAPTHRLTLVLAYAGVAEGAALGPAVGFADGEAGMAVGFGGRGGLPCMMSSTWPASSVSYSSSAAAIASTLLRLSSMSFLASAYCSSIMRRI